MLAEVKSKRDCCEEKVDKLAEEVDGLKGLFKQFIDESIDLWCIVGFTHGISENKRYVLNSLLKGIVIARHSVGLNTPIRLRRMLLGVEYFLPSEVKFSQLITLTGEQRTKLKNGFIQFDDPSFYEWMRSLKFLPLDPS
ncbi:hypothetical protein LguiB_011006 [Lonicera macranthoides]